MDRDKSRPSIRVAIRWTGAVAKYSGTTVMTKAFSRVLRDYVNGALVAPDLADLYKLGDEEFMSLRLSDAALLDQAVEKFRQDSGECSVSREGAVNAIARLLATNALKPAESVETVKPYYSSALAMRGLSQNARIIAFDR
jgi:hypothetical protein